MAFGSLALLVALAQSPPAPVRLASPAVLPHEFSLIRGLRELPDGRVLVTDWTEEILSVADFRTGAVRQIGRKGPGPLEYRLPGALIALPGDSTLMLDEGNSRFAIIGPGLTIARSYSNRRPGVPYAIYPRAADRLGRIYFTIPAWSEPTPLPGDSVAIARWTPAGDRVERLAAVKGYTPRRNTRTMGAPYVLFAPQDGWQADTDGRLVLVRSDRYRVERRRADGRTTSGPPTPWTPLQTTRQDRVDHVTRFVNASPISGRGEGASGLGQAPAALKSREVIERMVEQQEFAPVRPPFTDRGPWLGPDGVVWVERSVARGTAPTYDRFDAAGVRGVPVTFPAGRRLLAVGQRGVYAVATDADGIERLERYVVQGSGVRD